MLFPVGTEVVIRPHSYHWIGSYNNPKDNVGKVVVNDREALSGYIYEVEWSNGGSNNYKHSDLIEVYPFEGNV